METRNEAKDQGEAKLIDSLNTVLNRAYDISKFIIDNDFKGKLNTLVNAEVESNSKDAVVSQKQLAKIIRAIHTLVKDYKNSYDASYLQEAICLLHEVPFKTTETKGIFFAEKIETGTTTLGRLVEKLAASDKAIKVIKDDPVLVEEVQRKHKNILNPFPKSADRKGCFDEILINLHTSLAEILALDKKHVYLFHKDTNGNVMSQSIGDFVNYMQGRADPDKKLSRQADVDFVRNTYIMGKAHPSESTKDMKKVDEALKSMIEQSTYPKEYHDLLFNWLIINGGQVNQSVVTDLFASELGMSNLLFNRCGIEGGHANWFIENGKQRLSMVIYLANIVDEQMALVCPKNEKPILVNLEDTVKKYGKKAEGKQPAEALAALTATIELDISKDSKGRPQIEPKVKSLCYATFHEHERLPTAQDVRERFLTAIGQNVAHDQQNKTVEALQTTKNKM